MQLTFWPVVERELRVAARHPRTYRFRTATVLVTTLCGSAVMWFAKALRDLFGVSFSAFEVISTLAFFIIGIRGAIGTADAISEEKREQTLGLLFLTDLRGHDVIIGKLVSHSIPAFLALMTLFPLFAIAFTVGSVGVGEFWRVQLNMAVTLFLATSVGIFTSTLSLHYRRASSAATATMLFFLLGIPLLTEFLRRQTFPFGLTSGLSLFSPLHAHTMAFDKFAGLQSNRYWLSLLMTVCLGFGFLWIASILLPKVFQAKTVRSKPTYIRSWRLHKADDLYKTRRSGHAHLLNKSPYCWLVQRDNNGITTLWLMLLAAPVVIILSDALLSSSVESAAILTLVGLNAAALSVVANAASYRLAEDRHSGALEMILSTPLSIQRIFSGVWHALALRLLPPILLILIVDCIWLFSSLSEERRKISVVCVVVFGLGCLYILSLVLTSMWMAMRSGHPKHAPAAAFLRVVAVPWICFGTLMAITFSIRANVSRELILGILLICTVGIPVVLALWSLRCLYNHFRTQATLRFQFPTEHSGWKNLFLRPSRPATPPSV